MSRFLIALLFAATSLPIYAATNDDNKDDGSTIGTSESPQVQKQQDRTDKGATGVHQEGVADDASNLGTSETPQVQKQNMRTDKGVTQRQSKSKAKNKVLKEKEENAGTTKGNPVQPSEPESAPPAVN
ncbi:MAG: hypothetical protein V4570_05730 [Pseudomonadota bacterium]